MFRCILVAIFGASGNLLTLLAIPWAQKKKILGFDKTPASKYTTIFILNLAFADFLYYVTNLPLYSLTVSSAKCLLVVCIFEISVFFTEMARII